MDEIIGQEAQGGETVLRQSKPNYGWYIAVTLALTETISWGILYYTFSVFLTPMQAELGWSRSELTVGFSLALLVMGGCAFPVGAWIDRFGARALMTIGSVAACVLVLAWSQVTDRTTFYLIWTGLGASAAAVLYEPAFIVIAQWFREKRSTALAVITFAAGLASTIFLPLSAALLHAFGWRTAVFLLGILLGVVTVPLHALILRRLPNRYRAEKYTTQNDVSFKVAVTGRIFGLITLGFCLADLTADAIRVHLISYFIKVGIDASAAAAGVGAIGIMQVAGRIVFAPLERRWNVSSLIVGIFGLQAVAIMILLLGQTPLLIVLFVMLFGAAQGAITLARPTILAQLYGTSHYGRISSIMTIFLTISSTIAPLGASVLVDATGSYQLVLWTVLVTGLLATLVALSTNRLTTVKAQ